MPNRLVAASSPYLLQHRTNPVDWYEWGEDAFNAATLLDRPILLSVGYATCHWCHVMAHESFEDDETARYMNEHFVNIKVDREERPDIDRIYMDAVQAMTGRGGWPMTVFLTPDGRPFYAGTYFPRESRGQYPSFQDVMRAIRTAWAERRGELTEQADRLTDAVRATIPPADSPPDLAQVAAAVDAMAHSFDAEWGGFGGAPKFPQAPNLELLMRVIAIEVSPNHTETAKRMLTTTLDRMAAGGIYDHLGGGFSRYSVDRYWLVPHFEKMLYDNALLARVYLRSWQLLGVERYRTIATETLDYLLRDLADPSGGFHSGEDADSEGEEGTFYVWEWAELEGILGNDLAPIAAMFGASPGGNFEGKNILHLPPADPDRDATSHVDSEARAALLARAKTLLFARRGDRIRPAVDDKIVTAWNGLALRALAEAGVVLDEPRYRDAAVALAEFAERELISEGRLIRTWRHGVPGPAGFCEDYGALAIGLFTLYQATGEERWFGLGRQLTDTALRLFVAPDGGFFSTADQGDRLIARPKNLMDNPTPSDNALMAEAISLLIAYTADAELAEPLSDTFRAAGKLIEQYPSAVGHLLAVFATDAAGLKEVAIVGDPALRSPFENVVWADYRPDCVLASGDGTATQVPLLEGRNAPPGEVRAFVCRSFVCDLPAASTAELRRRL